MQSIVMDTEPEGWTDTEYKKFRVGESESDDDSDEEDEEDESKKGGVSKAKGYQAKEYKKILFIEELVSE
ncbi:hypothetical protein OAH93_01785 [Flavobacteriales bacterium]|jgi:hypothetical protein|nr:hypothetical protein [Flavobacteriales bacterium]